MITTRNAIEANRLLAKSPPADLDAERCVIGSTMLDFDLLDEITGIVRAEDFHDLAHEVLFRTLSEMHAHGQKCDLVLLVNRLKSAGELETVGGMSYILGCCESVATATHARYYAEIVRSNSVKRSLMNAGAAILRDAADPASDYRQLAGDAEQRVMAIMDNRSGNEMAVIREVVMEAMTRIHDRVEGLHATRGVSTGLEDLDRVTGGLHGSELIVIAGRPSMGKTALAMNIAEAVGVRQAKPTLFVSLEMSKLELADRLLCSMAKVNGHRLRNGTINDHDIESLHAVASDMQQAPLFIDDSPARTVSEIAATARRMNRREGSLALIVIDYLQLIDADNPRDSREQQVARMTRRLKGLARELETPVVVLAQLNRQAEATSNNRPRLSHLRESGAIEQDADVVMFVHREEYYRQGEDKSQFVGQAEIILAKQRNGPVDDIKVVWQSEYTRFANSESQEFQVKTGPFK